MMRSPNLGLVSNMFYFHPDPWGDFLQLCFKSVLQPPTKPRLGGAGRFNLPLTIDECVLTRLFFLIAPPRQADP